MLAHFDKTWDLLLEKLAAWLREAVLLLPNLTVAVIAMLLFWLAARGARNLLERLLQRISHISQINALLSQCFFVAVIVVGLFTSLGILGLDKAVTSLLAGAGIVGLALSLAFQGVAANFVAGIYLSIERPFQLGDQVETNGLLGTVERINLLWTELRMEQGQIVQLPNKKIFEDAITNYTVSDRRRLEIELRIAYGADLAKAKQLAVTALSDLAGRKGEPAAFIQEPGDSVIKLVVSVWLAATSEGAYQTARSEAIERLHVTFAEAGMPLPSALPVAPPQPAPQGARPTLAAAPAAGR
jgi:small conductance mechanosensitive channel